MKTKLRTLQMIVLSTFFIFCSCGDDNEAPTPDTPQGDTKDALMVVMSPKPNSIHEGASYMQIIDGSKKGMYDNTKGVQISYGSMPVVIGKDIFYLPFLGENAVIKYQQKGEKIIEVARLPIQADASPAQIVIAKEDKAYVSLFGKGKLLVVNPNTMKLIKEIPLFSYGKGDQNPNPGVMIVRDEKLFVGLGQMVGGLYSFKKDRPYSDMLVLDINTDKPIKMMTEKNSGIASSGRPTNQNDIFMDEHKDIYVVCLGAFGQPNYPKHHAGILRVKKGETDFDSSYQFNLANATIEGEEGGKIRFLVSSQYYKEGKLYALALLVGEKERVIPVEVDLANKKVKHIKELPESNMFGSVGIYKDKIVWGLSNTKERGFFMQQPNTKEMLAKEVFIKIKGHPSLFKELVD